MNCAYHSINAAVVNCNGCGKPLCPACDHRIKGFPFCQDCIVEGVEMLRSRTNAPNYVPFVKKRTSPLIATVLSLICPGLGAAYNGQTTKALVYFAVFIGLFQLAVLSGGTALFVLGFLGMWLFAAVDSWRTSQTFRSGITPDAAQDIIVQRFAGNPRLWGVVLLVLGVMFVLQNILPMRHFLRGAIPVLLVVLSLYLLRDQFFSGSSTGSSKGIFAKFKRETKPVFLAENTETSFRTADFQNDYHDQNGDNSWRSPH